MGKRAKKIKSKPAALLKAVPPIDSWPAAQSERWPVANIKPNPRNVNTHSEAQLAELEALYREYGQAKGSVLVEDDGTLICGEGNWRAAQRAGCTEIFVVVARGWSPEQKRVFALADNRVAEKSRRDETALGVELADLSKLPIVDLTGYGQRDRNRLIAPEIRDGQTDPNAAVGGNGQKIAISRAGDLWLLGKHRLLCGDATNADHVAAALGGLRPHLMVTDPPYGVDYEPGWRNHNGLKRDSLGSKSSEAGVLNDDTADWRDAWALFAGDVAYVWHAAMRADQVIVSLESCGFQRRAHIIWAKPHFAVGRGDYHWQHEPCWYVVRESKTGHWAGDRSQSTVWSITGNMGFHVKTEGADARVEHGTQKPVECMQRPIINNSRPGDAVYEPFSGSGTTIIAAEQTGRVCAAIEIDPAYVDVAILRWEAFTGLRAIHAAGGKEYADVSAERRREIAA